MNAVEQSIEKAETQLTQIVEAAKVLAAAQLTPH